LPGLPQVAQLQPGLVLLLDPFARRHTHGRCPLSLDETSATAYLTSGCATPRRPRPLPQQYGSTSVQLPSQEVDFPRHQGE
jgi:hypothetical protein